MKVNEYCKISKEQDEYILNLEYRLQDKQLKEDDILNLLDNIKTQLLDHIVNLEVLPERLHKTMIKRAEKFNQEIESILEMPL